MEKGDFVVKYTNKDIMDKLSELQLTTKEILEHAKITNGRVLYLENKSVGMWVANNPWKFTLLTIMFIAVFISDFRQPLFEMVRNFLGFL